MSIVERPRAPEQRTIDVDVESLDTRGRTVVGYAAVYGSLSEDLGGFRERIAPGAFAGVMDADVRALLNHDPNEVLGRTKSGTLRLADEQRGLRFELDLPDSPLGENVRSAVKRGDLDGASFRFIVGDEEWQDDVRTVTSVKELQDITLATYPAYPAASVELRTRPKEKTMSEEAALELEPEENDEERLMPSAGVLRVTQINEGQGESRTLLGTFRTRGFAPEQRASISWDEWMGATENRSLAWSGTIDPMSPIIRDSAPLGADRRYAWPAFDQVAVDPGVTSVQVFAQSVRTLASAANVVRAIDAVSDKPETGGTASVTTVTMKQLATVESGVPNIFLERPQMESIIGVDLRLAYNEGLDKLVLDATAGAAFQGTADPLLVGIRKSMTVLEAAGYSPDTVILRPADAEGLDLLVTGLTGGTADYVFGAGRFAPGQLFGLNVRVSKTAAAPIVLDASAFGKLYVGPVSLARFEENAGKTNTSLIRLEGNAVFGVERLTAARRIAAS
jgi:hypothetical protein